MHHLLTESYLQFSTQLDWDDLDLAHNLRCIKIFEEPVEWPSPDISLYNDQHGSSADTQQSYVARIHPQTQTFHFFWPNMASIAHYNKVTLSRGGHEAPLSKYRLRTIVIIRDFIEQWQPDERFLGC